MILNYINQKILQKTIIQFMATLNWNKVNASFYLNRQGLGFMKWNFIRM
jgi:hypothetical protein